MGLLPLSTRLSKKIKVLISEKQNVIHLMSLSTTCLVGLVVQVELAEVILIVPIQAAIATMAIFLKMLPPKYPHPIRKRLLP